MNSCTVENERNCKSFLSLLTVLKHELGCDGSPDPSKSVDLSQQNNTDSDQKKDRLVPYLTIVKGEKKIYIKKKKGRLLVNETEVIQLINIRLGQHLQLHHQII